MNERVKTLLDGRRERLQRVTGRVLTPPPGDPSPLPEADRVHLMDYARDLYQNELEWENITGEEQMGDRTLVSLAFPGFLAFVRGLLLSETMPDSLAPASPRPTVVEDILQFLGQQSVDLEERMLASDADEEDEARGAVALQMTDRLIDLVMFELYELTSEEIEALGG
jgi:hypothetical protein